jgi:hypothetical protein
MEWSMTYLSHNMIIVEASSSPESKWAFAVSMRSLMQLKNPKHRLEKSVPML